MRIYVINLARSLDRRGRMSEKLAGSSAIVEFVEAADGATVDRTLYPMAHGLSDGEVGCYLSHVAVWKRLAASDHASALVLEDDVVFEADLDDLCDAFCGLPFEVDLIRISSLKKAKGMDAWRLGSRRLLIADMHPSGSQGYWLSRQGATRLLAAMTAPSQELDKALDRCWQSKMHAFLLDPPAVCEEPSAISMIAKRSNRRRPGWMARRWEGWRRRIANRRQKRHLQAQLKK